MSHQEQNNERGDWLRAEGRRPSSVMLRTTDIPETHGSDPDSGSSADAGRPPDRAEAVAGRHAAPLERGRDTRREPEDDRARDAPEPETGSETPQDDRSAWQKGRDVVRAHPLGSAVVALALVAAIAAALLWYLDARHFETTDDAFIDARSFSVSAKVGGYLTEVPVSDNQHVPAGTLVGRVDSRDYDVAVDQAQAQVDAAAANVESALAQARAQEAQVTEAQAQARQSQAALDFAREENGRAQELVAKGAGTAQRAQQTASQLTQAQAALAQSEAALKAAMTQISVLQAQGKTAAANAAQARAQLEQARLNLAYTEVRTAQAGRVARLTAAQGQLIQAGQSLAMLVPDELWITANFKETQLADMRPGQPVDVTIDAYPGRTFKGRVDSVQRGSGTVFSLLPAQNATGNYVKVVQRVPVKLVFDERPGDVAIGPGLSVVPKVRVR